MNKRFTIVLVFFTAVISACGYGKAVVPAEPKGFIERRAEDSPGIVRQKTPFQYAWAAPELKELQAVDKEQTYKLYVAPVGVKLLELSNDNKDLSARVDEIADYLTGKIVEEVNALEAGSLKPQITNHRRDADYVLEIQLTEAGFGSPLLYTAAFATPLPGVATAYDSNYTSVLAMELRVVQLRSGKVVAEVADRKIPKIRILDLNKVVSKTAPLREICNRWAKEIAGSLTLNLNTDEKAKRTRNFTLIPW